MTLVLPFGCDQISNKSLFSGPGSNQNSSMPCVFDSEAFDRELQSALMTDWTSDIIDYDIPAADSPLKPPSDSNELKRKVTDVDFEAPSSPKKPRVDSDDSVPPLQSKTISSSTSSILSSSDLSSISSASFSAPSLQSRSTSTSCSSSSSSSSSSSEGGQDDEISVDADDEDYLPRRRGPQMWNSRQRWKDERKKVLKMSINKLSDIEDPEMCLLRSVLINNTIKKLHLDIRNDRQAKLRHRQQQRIDFFSERFPPFSSSHTEDSVMSECFSIDFSNGDNNSSSSATKPNTSTSTVNTEDFHDDSSCDEIFGINEDFLRVPVPDRRVSSPIPTGTSNQSRSRDSAPDSKCTTPPCCSNTCDTAADCGSFRTTQNNSQTVSTSATPPSISQTTATPQTSNSSSRRVGGSAVSSLPNGGSHCAMQYRTNRDLGAAEVSFPPRVPILDSVVYHSLLASLESS